MFQNSKYWIGVCDLEFMSSDWQLRIDDLLQVPFAYAIHYLDHDPKSKPCIDHVHVVLAFPNITTFKHALSVFNLLSSVDTRCCPIVQSLNGLSHVCDYLNRHTDSFCSYGNGFDSLCHVPSSN